MKKVIIDSLNINNDSESYGKMSSINEFLITRTTKFQKHNLKPTEKCGQNQTHNNNRYKRARIA